MEEEFAKRQAKLEQERRERALAIVLASSSTLSSGDFDFKKGDESIPNSFLAKAKYAFL